MEKSCAFYNIAKRQPAAAISQNQNGREMIEELEDEELADAELDVLLVPDEPLDEPPEDEVPDEPVVEAAEEPGEVGVREDTVVVSMIVVSGEVEVEVRVDRGLNEVEMMEEEDRVREGTRAVEDCNITEEESSLEAVLEGVEVLDDESVELGSELEVDDVDKPEVGVADGLTAADAIAFAVALVDVTFKLKLLTSNVTLAEEWKVSDPNCRTPM